MQAIGTRPHCACREELPMDLPKAGTKGTLNPYKCQCGGVACDPRPRIAAVVAVVHQGKDSVVFCIP